jgi:hypothetical protein
LIPWILNDITPRARILLTGRQDPHVTRLLAGLPTVTLGSDGTTQSDLEVYARHVVRIYMGSNDPEEAQLVQDLVRRSENMFQYIFLVQNLTLDPHLYNRERRLQFLNNTPPDIFGMYDYYLAVQLQQFGDPEFKRVLEILLQLLKFSPSPVTPLIFLQALQSCPSIRGLELNPETDKLAIDLARNAAGILFNVQVTTTGVQHLVPVHNTLIEYFLVPGGNRRYNIDGVSPATQKALVSLHNAVRETGPESLLELCCNGLRHQDFNRSLHNYQYAADFCRQCIDDTSTRGIRPDKSRQRKNSTRGVQPDISRQQIDRERLQAQLFRDFAFSIQDSLRLEEDWMERQWNSLKEDREWFETRSANMKDYEDEKTLSLLLRIKISRWRDFVCPGMKEQLELGQKALSELKTRDWSGYAFR